MKSLIIGGIGFIIGTIVTLILVKIKGPSLMLLEEGSPYDYDEATKRIEENVKNNGWKILGDYDFHQIILNAEKKDINKMRIFSICHPKYAGEVLIEEPNRPVSVMMPCSITVYKKNNGKCYVATMRAGIMGKLFGGTIARVMSEVSEIQDRFKDFINKG
jgi:uncharacterized protein (DUF302 family)